MANSIQIWRLRARSGLCSLADLIILPSGSRPQRLQVNTRELHGSNPWTLEEQSWIAGQDIHHERICVIREQSVSGHACVDDVNLAPLLEDSHTP